MSKVAVVYWSGTGNTEIMANKVAEGAKAGGAEVEVFEAEGFSADKMDEFDAVAFGCPSMGCEELEDTIFEPMFASCESKLQGKKIALFGSYGWGDGEWMQTWEGNQVWVSPFDEAGVPCAVRRPVSVGKRTSWHLC